MIKPFQRPRFGYWLCAIRVVVAAMLIPSVANCADLDEIARGMRNAGEISRQGKSIYKQVQPTIKTNAAKRDPTLPSGGNEVVFYSASWCGYCNKARAYMRQEGVPYVEYDTQTTAKGREDYAALNARGVPVLLIGDQRLNGWDERRFRQLYSQFRSAGATSSTDTAPLKRNSSRDGYAIAAGTVLAAKIANVAVLTSNSRGSEVVARLRKGEEVVAIDSAAGGFVAVETASGNGWVDPRLMKIQEQD
jgi:glutaredoxin